MLKVSVELKVTPAQIRKLWDLVVLILLLIK